jgi:hypothetical protein
MKQKVGFLIGIVLLFVVIGIIITVVRSRSPKQGELKVESQPTASVFLDEKHIGRTPIGKTSYKVNSGEYTLKITPDTGAVTLANFQEKIKISPNTLTYVDVILSESDLTTSSYVLWLEKMTGKKSELSVVTTPDGANVLLDDEPKGISPMIISDVTPGDHTLSVVSRGFITRTVKIKLNAGYRLIASIKLSLAPGGTAPTEDTTATGSGKPAETKPTPKGSITGTPKVTPTKSTSAEPAKPYALIKDTPTGFLRVRSDAATTSAELARVKPGEKYSILDEKTDWFKIQLEATKSGWISSQYAQKVE